VTPESTIHGTTELASELASALASELGRHARPTATPALDVARMCRAIAARPELARDLTDIGQTVAVISNGTAVLDLGDAGPRASMPVLESKAALLRQLTGLRAIPIAVDAKEPDRFVATIQAIAPSFGAILIEHVSAPMCFEVESRLDAQLRVPVVHDDRACTAVVTLAALLRTSRRLSRPLPGCRVGIVGMGPAGTGIAQLLLAHGVRELRGVDVDTDALDRLRELGGRPESLATILTACDVIVAVTGQPGLIPIAAVRPHQVILSMSSTSPEIEVEAALAAGAAVAADGNTIDTQLAFPGLLRGALEARASSISMPMLLAAAHALSELAQDDALLPDPFDPRTHQEVADAVRDAA
jgi:malate dehydrogenase (oxaloacetate-decarboxylating)